MWPSWPCATLTKQHCVHARCDAVGKDTFDASLASLDYLGWFLSFGNASGKPEAFDVLRSVARGVSAWSLQ